MPVLKVDVVTAEERLYEGTAKFVVIPGTEGELGILPGHERLLTRLRPGTVRVTLENDEEVILFVAGGFVDVQPEQVIVLADTAVRARDLDEVKAQQARKAAEVRVRAQVVLSRIAEEEKIDLTQEEFSQAIINIAYTEKTPPEKLVKDRKRLAIIRRDALLNKALDLILGEEKPELVEKS